METPYKFIQPVFVDNRGSFTPIKLDPKWVQSNISINEQIFVFRGLHYQTGDMAQTKQLSVIQGRVVDFVVNINIDSPDFGKVDTFVLSAGEAAYVPKGYAHGFLTLKSNTIVNYLVDEVYSPSSEGCIKWDSVEEVKEVINNYMRGFTFKLVISEKDNEGITLEEYKKL